MNEALLKMHEVAAEYFREQLADSAHRETEAGFTG